MMLVLLEWLTLVLAAASALMFLVHLAQFRRPPRIEPSASDDGSLARLGPVSVLIPARNEAAGIAQSLRQILACQSVEFELLVLDDHSTDGTAAIVAKIAETDPRVRLIAGERLPDGWCGKQFACYQLAAQARFDKLLFLDADVHLTPDAIPRMLMFQAQVSKPLVSGFPRQITGSLGEALLIPLMHLVLLTYLPFRMMRRTNMPAASAGCGQLFLADRSSYQQVGGHRAIAASLHDGVTLPRAFRARGFGTDVFDASTVARCRMYRDWRSTWSGLMKNAHEGIANRRLIGPFTFLLLGGFVAPAVLAAGQLLGTGHIHPPVFAALVLAFVPRIMMAWRFDRRWLVVPLFPLAVTLFVALQWAAIYRQARGRQTAWRGREYPLQSAS